MISLSALKRLTNIRQPFIRIGIPKFVIIFIISFRDFEFTKKRCSHLEIPGLCLILLRIVFLWEGL